MNLTNRKDKKMISAMLIYCTPLMIFYGDILPFLRRLTYYFLVPALLARLRTTRSILQFLQLLLSSALAPAWRDLRDTKKQKIGDI
jgi:hypothetical protein